MKSMKNIDVDNHFRVTYHFNLFSLRLIKHKQSCILLNMHMVFGFDNMLYKSNNDAKMILNIVLLAYHG